MTRQQALNQIWKKLLLVFLILSATTISVAYLGKDARVPILVFLFGNIGAYVGVHRNLADLSDGELSDLAGSWLGLVIPSFVGGILALVLYLLFLSEIVGGELFPSFTNDSKPTLKENFDIILNQHAPTAADYAKLLFWSFLAGFNQKYAVDIIDSVKNRT